MTTDPPTKEQFDQQMTRLVRHYHPGRNTQDFTGWADEIRRHFGAQPADAMLRAISLWKLKESQLPKIATFTAYLDEAKLQLRRENEKRLPAPEMKRSPKPPPEVMLRHLAVGVAIYRNSKEGIYSSPTEEQIRQIMREKRALLHIKEVDIGREEWMFPRRKVRIVTPQHIPEDETWAKINGFPEMVKAGMNEASFQDLCEDIAARYGWTVYHETDSRKSPMGLPDLIMLSPLQGDGTVVLALLELKTEKGKLTEPQQLWQMKLGKVDRLVTGVLRPSGWQAFVNLCFDPQGSTAVDPLTEEGVPTDV